MMAPQAEVCFKRVAWSFRAFLLASFSFSLPHFLFTSAAITQEERLRGGRGGEGNGRRGGETTVVGC